MSVARLPCFHNVTRKMGSAVVRWEFSVKNVTAVKMDIGSCSQRVSVYSRKMTRSFPIDDMMDDRT